MKLYKIALILKIIIMNKYYKLKIKKLLKMNKIKL